jgi:hypothetical protein
MNSELNFFRKKLIILTVIFKTKELGLKLRLKSLLCLVLLSFSFLSYGEDKSSGCGPGSLLVPRKSILSTATARVIDASSTYGLSNYLGSTFGTSGCAKHSLVLKEQEKSIYISSNLSQIKLESALGGGEHLVALGQLYGCEGVKNNGFSKLMKNHFKSIFKNNDTASIKNNIQHGLTHSLQGCII